MGPGGKLNTYSECTAFPVLAITRLEKLYDARLCVLNAFQSIGTVLAANSDVESAPATIGIAESNPWSPVPKLISTETSLRRTDGWFTCRWLEQGLVDQLESQSSYRHRLWWLPKVN